MNSLLRSVRWVALSASFLALAHVSTAEPARQDFNRQEWVKFWEKRQPPFTTTEYSAPITFTGDCPIVQLQINGKPAIRALLDTGGAGLYLKPETAKRLGVTPQKGMIRVESFKIGTMELKNIFLMSQWPDKFNKGNMEAVIGASLLCEFVLTVDYENKKAVFGARAKLPAVTDGEDDKRRAAVMDRAKKDGAVYVPIVSANKEPQPFGMVEINGVEHRFGLDTGYTVNVIKKETAEKLSLKIDGNRVTGTVKMGELSLPNVTFSLNSSPNVPDILGEAFFKNFKKITFDFVNRDVLLYPAK